jgi:pyruvate/2-oxoglutarate dehydrogenase complex dihydrolipoamide dehydrogenase (E3) component
LIRDNSPKNALMKIGLDKDIAATLVADLIRSGIKIERGCEAGTIEVPSSSAMASATAANAYNNQNRIVPLKISLKAKGGENDRPLNSVHEIKCDAYVAAVGRLPNTNNLNLEAAGIEVDEYGGIAVDNLFRANGVKDRNVYGAGDVLGRPFLASTGVAQGIAAVKNMFPPSNPIDNDTSAIVSACDPNDESCAVEDDLLSQAAGVNPTTLTANPVSSFEPCVLDPHSFS